MKIDIFHTEKRYRVIYADPPWKFSSKEAFHNGYVALEKVYETLSTNDMSEWDIESIAEKDAALFMWATDAHLEEAIRLFKAWGFHYVTVAFIWKKISSKGNTLSNLGYWTLKNCELCLFGTRGSMIQYKQVNNVKQLVEAPRGRHSEKPEEVRLRIERLFGDVPRIELFARKCTEGWDYWGNEV